MSTLLKNGTVIDYAQKIEKKLDILIENDKIVKLAENLEIELSEEKKVEQNINQSLGEKIFEAQKTFLESDIGKAVNMAVDIG